MEDAYRDAAQLLWQRRYGTLSTLSLRYEGWPFGSVTPYALDSSFAPLILIASIAEHTKNIQRDPRVSLLVHESGAGDVQAQGRVSVLGRAQRVESSALPAARARYLSRLPEASGYFGTHDFELYRIEPLHLRFIGGFGRIHWLEGAKLTALATADPLAPAAAGVVAHMNADHADALKLYCKAFRNLDVESAQMLEVDAYGFDLQTQGPEHRIRFDFEEPATPDSIRQVMVKMVVKARAQVG